MQGISENISSSEIYASPKKKGQERKILLRGQQKLPKALGECIERDAQLVKRLGWRRFVEQRRGRGDWGKLENLRHPAKGLLNYYKRCGVPIVLHSAPWSKNKLKQTLLRGPHKSCNDHVDFLYDEFTDMIRKGQWVVLPYSLIKQFQ